MAALKVFYDDVTLNVFYDDVLNGENVSTKVSDEGTLPEQ